MVGMKESTMRAMSYFRGPSMEPVTLVNYDFSVTPHFLVLPGVPYPLPLRRINSSEVDEEEGFEIWNLHFLSYEKVVYVGDYECIELTKSSSDPLHKDLDVLLCLLIDGEIDKNY
jgi:hypothetical protein